jgi:O-antigen/teichoic acid export membrane protein
MFRTIGDYFQNTKRNSVIHQSLLTLILRVFGVLILFGFTLYLTNNFSPKIVGQYDFVRSYLFVVGSICLLGCDQSILYFRGKFKGADVLSSLKSIYLKMVGIILIMTIILFAILLAFSESFINSFFEDQGVYRLFYQASIILFFYSITTLNIELIRALDHLYVAELFRNSIKYIPLIIGAVIINYTNNQTYLVAVFLGSFIILFFMTIIVVFYYFSKKQPNSVVVFTSYKEIVTKSYPIAVSSLALFLLISFDIMFLKKYKDDATIAFYALAVKLMTVLSMIIVTVNITVSTKIAEFYSKKSLGELKKILKSSSRLIFVLTLPAALFICFFSDSILVFFGKEYAVARDTLMILTIGQLVCSAFGSAPVYLNMTGRQHIFQRILLLALIINLGFNRFLIPIYGMTGAATAYVISSLFWNVCSAAVIYKKDKMIVFLN